MRSQFPWPGTEPTPPPVEEQTPNCWTAREVPHPQFSVAKWQMTTCTHTIHSFACKNDSFHINHRIYLIQMKHETRITFGPYQVAITLFKKKKKEQYVSVYILAIQQGTRRSSLLRWRIQQSPPMLVVLRGRGDTDHTSYKMILQHVWRRGNSLVIDEKQSPSSRK